MTREDCERMRYRWYGIYKYPEERWTFIQDFKKHQTNLELALWEEEKDIKRNYRNQLWSAKKESEIEGIKNAFDQRMLEFRMESKEREKALENKREQYEKELDEWFNTFTNGILTSQSSK